MAIQRSRSPTLHLTVSTTKVCGSVASAVLADHLCFERAISLVFMPDDQGG